MKKIYLALIASVIAAIMPMQILAAESKLVATNDKGTVEVNITNSVTTQKADAVLPGIKECVEPATEEITLKADAGVIASLRLTLPAVSTTGTTPLNNYDIVVKDGYGETIYNSTSAIQAKLNDTYKEIMLGELQANETKKYTITYKIIDNSVDVSNVSIELVAKTNNIVATATAQPTSTLKPKFDFDSLEKQEEFIFDLSEKDDDENKTDSDTKTNEIKKVCGVDIPEGRFEITGNGNLKITSTAGAVKKEVVISEKPEEGKSVDKEVVFIQKGDIISITPIAGQEKARLKFNKLTIAEPTESETPSPTKTPTPAKEAAAKTNPKTGDGSIGIIIGVCAVAVLAFVLLEVLKRRSKNNN